MVLCDQRQLLLAKDFLRRRILFWLGCLALRRRASLLPDVSRLAANPSHQRHWQVQKLVTSPKPYNWSHSSKPLVSHILALVDLIGKLVFRLGLITESSVKGLFLTHQGMHHAAQLQKLRPAFGLVSPKRSLRFLFLREWCCFFRERNYWSMKTTTLRSLVYWLCRFDSNSLNPSFLQRWASTRGLCVRTWIQKKTNKFIRKNS